MYKFQPKKPIRSFRDLEVYQKTLDCAVVYSTAVKPKLVQLKYDLLEGMTNCALSIPLYIAEAHGMRSSDFKAAVATLEKGMLGCNKMIVYLEQVKGIYGSQLNLARHPTQPRQAREEQFIGDLLDELSGRYMDLRGKMFRLEKSWQKFRQADQNLSRLKK